ncbi:MAG TPA: TonB-dependent receptor, partial [Thermoanaerobaculia bacterium]|nr:TonB-dependent receptor [Thermoanaerobaculia bacterium]
TIDGVDFNNAFFGGTVGTAEGRAPLSISQESIKEFTVITNGASVEFGRSGGGFVNVITKSGTNNLHGSAFYYDQPQDLISDFPNGTEPAEQEKQQYGASIGGPILQDRLFYFLSYDNQDQSVSVPIDPLLLDQDIFGRYPVLASPDTYSSTQDGSVLFGRLDFQASPSHRFMLRGNFTEYEGINGTSTSNTRTASFNGLEGLNSDSWVASYSSQWGANLLNDLNINYITEDMPRNDKGLNLPEIQVTLGSISARYGEVAFLPIETTTDRRAIADTLSYSLGRHFLKAGFEYNDTSVDQVFRGNWRGVFIFNNEADLLAGRWTEYRQFGGLNGLTSSEAGRSDFAQEETALFLQDQWFVRPNLTISAGVRWERLDNPDFAILNPNDVDTAAGRLRLTAQIPDSDNQISPRLGISWAPDEKTAVRFSAGRYWSRTPALLWAQTFTSNGIRGTQLTVRRDANGNITNGPADTPSPAWGPGWSPEGIERIDLGRLTRLAAPGVYTVDPDFENPYTDRATLGIEREIFRLASFGLDFTYAEGKQLQRLTDINRVYDPANPPTPNGLPRYSNTRPLSGYDRVIMNVSDAESEYTAVTATLQRRYADNFSLYGAVTWSEDKDHDSNERNFAGIQSEDFNNLDLNWGYSNRDQRWKGVLNGLWDTPWWGLGLSGSFRYSTGQPFTATTNSDFNNDGVRETDRPTVGGEHFDRNSFRQPDFWTLDMRLSKGFDLGPGELTLFAECFNCTDRTNPFTTRTVWGTAQTPAAGFAGENSWIGNPRTLQLALRYDF